MNEQSSLKKQLMVGAAFVVLAGVNPLMAADLAVKAPVYKAAPVAVYNWTGCYAGANAGYSWGRSKGDIDIPGLGTLAPPLPTTFSISSNPQGAIGGLQIGCDRQVDDRWVLGFEADIQASGQRASTTFSAFNTGAEGVTGRVDSKLRWFGTLRGVAGVLVTPTVMLYGTGGLAYGNASVSSTITVSDGGITSTALLNSSSNLVGYTLGAGVTGAFPNSSNWTWKLEYLYVDLGSLSSAGTNPALRGSFDYSTRITDNILRLGVNYRFGGWGTAPVVAKY
jgi:outer membrane immunogenic protein